MSNLLPFRPVPDQIAGYRFGAAELLLAQQRLLVEGREGPLPQLAFCLLLGLCRVRGGFLSRNEMFECLWPGGGSGSDEALTQIVAKARQALGSERALLATLRGRGFCLDAHIEVMPQVVAPAAANVPAARPPPDAETVVGPVPAPTSAPRKRQRRWLIPALLSLLALGVVLVLAMRSWNTEAETLNGLAVRVDDFGTVSTAGKAMLRTALAREDAGGRASARQLVLPLVEGEPYSAVVFFLLL